MTTSKIEKDGLSKDNCNDCGACGIAACCSALDYLMTNNSIHCKAYLKELKFGYTCYQKIYELIIDNQGKYPELYRAAEDIREDAEPSITF
ncbi:hypothetical protein [Ferruginibacter sp.]|nr:hypothetical protein [Ferruginibacter sp.]